MIEILVAVLVLPGVRPNRYTSLLLRGNVVKNDQSSGLMKITTLIKSAALR